MKTEQEQINSKDYIKAEIPIVQKIIRDETWYEGERRGCKVDPDDTEVVKKVCTIIKKHDRELKEETLRSLKKK